MENLKQEFGEIDIYLFDQILKGRITPEMTVLDAGSGAGRNNHYFLNSGYTVFAADKDAAAVEENKKKFNELAPDLPLDNLHIEAVENMSFPDAFADVVLSIAVLHFANDEEHFWKMLEGTWRTLKPGGLFFCRLASSIGIEDQIRVISERRYKLSDSTERFLVDYDLLVDATEKLMAELLDPIKTTVIQNKRSMTTWVLRKVN